MILKAFFSDPAGTRTQGPYIKSVLLYQLSYGVVYLFRKRTAKIVFWSKNANPNNKKNITY